MADQSGGYQIVEVLSECRLLDGARHEKVYWRRDGRCLEPGFYIVTEPPGTSERFYEDALFRGPYTKRECAEAALQELDAR